MFGFLLTNAKKRAIIPPQLNTNSIRASGGNLDRLDYQAPCESEWYGIIVSFSIRTRAGIGNGWTTERRASQNDIGLLYHFGSTAFFDARIARTKSLFHLLGKRLFLFPEKLSELRNNLLFSPCSTYGKEKSKFFHSEGLKTRGSFCIWWRDLRSRRKNWILFSTTGVYSNDPLSEEDEGRL